MSKGKKYKGYYCPRCHNYSRIYLNPATGLYEGHCSKCGKETTLAPDNKGQALFQNQVIEKRDAINIRDSYQGGRIVGSIPAGTPAKVLRKEKYNGVIWYLVSFGNVQGWVSGSYIRKLRG